MKIKNYWALAVAFSYVFCVVGLMSCDKDDTSDVPEIPDVDTEVGIGTYIWGEDVYALGNDAAETLAEMYSKTNIKTVYLLVKGSTGTVGFLANPNGEYKLARTDRDILQEIITSMHARNIKVYAWLYCSEDNYYGETHPEDLCYHFRNGTKKMLPDLNSSQFIEYLCGMIKTIRENYQVDGFMFDHVRYNGLYFGWDKRDFTAMTTDPKIGMTLDEYNEVVRLMAATYAYPIAKNDEGRYVYNSDNPEIEESIPNAIFNEADKGNEAVAKLMKYRELTVDRISSALLSACKGLPTMYASMPEVVTSPALATLSYGTTINDTHMFTYVSPMLYSQDYGENAKWVRKGCNFLHLHKYDCVPSLQAYGGTSTAILQEDIAAVKAEGCANYILFQSFAYDIARVTAPERNTINIAYIKAAKSSAGTVKVNVSDASKIKSVSFGGAFIGKQYTLDGNTLTVSGENFMKIGDEGTITFELTDNTEITSVESDCIVWLDAD